MITPLTFLDELEHAFPELGREIAAQRAKVDPGTVASEVFGWVTLLGLPLGKALAEDDEAMLRRCFDFLEVLYREGHRQVLTAVNARIFERLDTPEFRAACREHAGPYTLMAQKFESEGISAD